MIILIWIGIILVIFGIIRVLVKPYSGFWDCVLDIFWLDLLFDLLGNLLEAFSEADIDLD